MSAIAFLPMLIVALLALGGVAAVVYLVVHALADKRPGGVLMVLLGLAVGVLAAVLLRNMAAVDAPVVHVARSQSAHMHGGGAQAAISGGHLRIPMVALAVVAVIIGGLVAVKRMWRSGGSGERRGQWGLPLLALAAIVLVGMSVVVVSRERSVGPRQVNFQTGPWPGQMVGQQAGALAVGQAQTVDQVFEQLNKSRIQLVTPTVPQIDGPSPPTPSAAPATDSSPETAKLLANIVKQIDTLARQFAVIAEQLSKNKDVAHGSALPPTASVETAATVEAAADGGTESATPAASEPPAAVAQASLATAGATSSPGRATTASATASSDAPDGAAEPASSNAIDPTGSAAADEASAGPRPAWVDEPPKRVGTEWREVLAAGEYATVAECNRAADELLAMATWEHVQQLANRRPASDNADWDRDVSSTKFRSLLPLVRADLAKMGVGIDYIRRDIATKEHVETVERSVGPMKTLYTLAEFSPTVDRELRWRWDAYERTERFAIVGVIAASVLGLIGTVYGLLKIDTWTKGYYSKRLFLGVPAVIIGLVALLAWIGGI